MTGRKKVRERNAWFEFSLTFPIALASISYINVMLYDFDALFELLYEQDTDVCLNLDFLSILNFAFFSFAASGKINK